MKISSDNAVMSPIPLNTSRFYRFHYSMTATKFSFRLIISAKRMKFTALIILLAAQNLRSRRYQYQIRTLRRIYLR